MTTDTTLAARAEIPVEILRAIRSIESDNNPSAVRFEPHLFLRRVPGADIPFTRDPERGISLVRSETNREAFERARRINEQAAIESTSWGLYQVLGSHLLRIRPSDPVGSFDRDPRGVSDELLVSWFRSRPAAQEAARAFNVERLAELYNGSVRWGQRLRAALEAGAGEGGAAVAAGILVPTLIVAGAVWYFSRGRRGGLSAVPVAKPRRKRRR
jgi:hypothetical protein